MIATLRDLAQMLGLSEQNAGDLLTSERAARAVLSRRNLFAAGAAMASAAAFSFPPPSSLAFHTGSFRMPANWTVIQWSMDGGKTWMDLLPDDWNFRERINTKGSP